MTHAELKAKLRKIEALYAGATTPGERLAAEAAIKRIKQRLDEFARTEDSIEMRFRITDTWSRQLFLALCRRYGLRPFRYPRQRYTSVMVKAPRSFIDRTLWPEFQEINSALEGYLSAITNRIIREQIYQDAGEAPETG